VTFFSPSCSPSWAKAVEANNINIAINEIAVKTFFIFISVLYFLEQLVNKSTSFYFVKETK